MSFDVGPSNDEFVPLDQISPYLIKSIMSTEDSAFYQHHGFITSEFRTALINNLKAGKFVQGASSITMQMVKNVLLYREKTLARVPELKALQGTMGTSAASLLHAMQTLSDVNREANRLDDNTYKLELDWWTQCSGPDDGIPSSAMASVTS